MGLNRPENDGPTTEAEKLKWFQWNPGVDNDDMRLGEILDSLPAIPPSAVPWQIRMLENPASPIALPGAIDLFNHDAVHVVLGRGLKLQDEAFVIGYTMGNDARAREWHKRLFRLASSKFYPKPYNFSTQDLMAFRIAWRLGEEVKRRHAFSNIHQVDFSKRLDERITDVRRSVGLLSSMLHSAFAYEQSLLSGSSASHRLDTSRDWDPSSLTTPQGEDVGAWKKQK